MAFIQYNPNPVPHNRVGDCVIRAISKALGQTWEETYSGIALKGYELANMPSANHVWGSYLKDKGYGRHIIPDEHVSGYTVADFAHDHPYGTYILALDGHVVCVKDGDWWDTWDSRNETPVYYWEKSKK